MRKLPIALSLAASAALAGCAGQFPQDVAVVATPVMGSPAIAYPGGATVAVESAGYMVQTVVALRSGFGRVEAILPMVDANGPIRRLSVRMEDGSLQVADTRGPYISIGTRVEFTHDSHILYRVATL